MIACLIQVSESTDRYEGLCARIAELESSEMELKSTAAALDETRRAIAALMDNLPGMAYRCRYDQDRTMVFVSHGCRNLTGLTAAELTNGNAGVYVALIHRDDREGVFAEIERAVAGREPFRLIYRICRTDGSEKWVWEHGHAVCGTDGMPYALDGFVMDITEYKQVDMELKEKARKHEQAMMGTIQAISRMIAMRDAYTARHEERVADLASAVAADLGLPAGQIECVRTAALIHDIGKINIPVEILNKPGQLNPFEFHFVREHARSGYDILQGIEFPWPIADIVWQHHERLDGSGYPRGLRGEDILMEARIIAVADVVEAMASDRPYRPAVGLDAAISEITDGKGGRYDGAVVAACLRVLDGRDLSFLKGGPAL
jgi:putative nucleotidyltransferase with HDIG domain/PAS domain S-box-containing protein